MENDLQPVEVIEFKARYGFKMETLVGRVMKKKWGAPQTNTKYWAKVKAQEKKRFKESDSELIGE